MRAPLAQVLLAQAHAAKLAGKRIAFDPNYRNLDKTADYPEIFRAIAALSTYIKVSDDDLHGLFPGLTSGDALSALRALSPDAEILLTRGAEGMTLFSEGEIIEQTAYQIEVVDTVGCGDAAMGGWIASLLSRPFAAKSAHLQVSAAAAALAATHAGPYPPSALEVDELLKARGCMSWLL